MEGEKNECLDEGMDRRTDELKDRWVLKNGRIEDRQMKG